MAGDPMDRMANAVESLAQRLAALEARIARLEGGRGSEAVQRADQPRFREGELPLRRDVIDQLDDLAAEKEALLREEERIDHLETVAEAPVTEPSAPPPAAAAGVRGEPLELKPMEPAPAVPEAEMPQTSQPMPPTMEPGISPGVASPGREERIAAFLSKLRHEAPQASRPYPSPERISVETKIGMKWAAVVGGLAVLFGALFFLKLAWDKGWLRPSPLARIMLAMATGVVMAGVGEWVHRKKMAILAAALNGAGLAIIMAAFFAAHTLFAPPVFSRETAFAGVLVTGLAGIVLSLRAGQMSLAILALVGMYLSPAILGGREDGSLALLVYLGVVGATGLGASVMRPTWHAVRWVATAGLWSWTLLWASVGPGDKHLVLGMVACATFMGFGIAEAVATLRRYWDKVAGIARVVMEGQASLALFLNVGVALASVWSLFARTQMEGLWAVPLALAGVVAPLVFATRSQTFSIAATVLATGLITLAVPLYFGGVAITWAWATMALALAAFAFIRDNKTARAWSFALLWLVIARLLTFDFVDEGLRMPFFQVWRQTIPWWIGETWAVAGLSLSLSWLLRVKQATAGRAKAIELQLGRIARIVAVCVFALGALRTLETGSEAAMVHAIVLGALAWWLADPVAKFTASAVLIAAVLRVFLGDPYDPRLQWPLLVIWRQAITPWLLVAWASAIVAEVLAWMAHKWSRPHERDFVTLNAAMGTVVFAMAGVLQLHSGSELALGHVLVLGVLAVIGASPMLRIVALCVLTLVVGRILFVEPHEPGVHKHLFQLFGHGVPQWVALAWITAIIAQGLALTVRTSERNSASLRGFGSVPGILAAVLSTVCFIGATEQAYTSFSVLTFAAAIWTFALLGLGRLFPRMGYDKQVLLLVTVLIFKWAFFDGIGAMLNEMETFASPFVNLFTLNAILVAGLVMLAESVWNAPGISLRSARAWVVAAICFLWLNIEILRTVDYVMAGGTAWVGSPWIVKNVALSVFWAVVGFGCVIVGFGRSVPAQRWAGLVLLGITVAKVILVDMANVETILRVLAFIVVGIVLLAVSFVYHRHVAQEKAPARMS